MLSLQSALLFAAPKGANQPDAMYCLVCHGSNAQGSEVIGGPNLSILPDWYLRGQLAGFQHGWRGKHEADSYSTEMQMIARSMSEQDIELAINFIKSLPAKQAQPMLSGNTEHGKQLYQSCAACHGTNGQLGDEFFVPLAGMPVNQFVKTMKDFKEGRRPATLMGHVANGFTDADLKQMAEFFAAVPPLKTTIKGDKPWATTYFIPEENG